MPIVLLLLSGTTIASNKYTGSEETKVQIPSWEFIKNEQDTVSPQNMLGSNIEGLAARSSNVGIEYGGKGDRGGADRCEDREGPDDKGTDGDGQDEGQDDEGADGKGTDPDPKEPDAKGLNKGSDDEGLDDEGLDDEGLDDEGLDDKGDSQTMLSRG
ncbi:hypothetical protein BS47DRAFT_1369687 [Hydnum rufescens UP504]|uniref:Glycine-rich protein n=1 Tax=Hydnum rufescens UP504 TaxID=1448309 RepID=A0A9P6ADM8_9AGAM|nr:hypothetical protein BS47DRAFT_1369687 [Hydnum rufescens UP504]